MRKALLTTAALLALLAVLGWAGLGANRGWTRTSVPVKTTDEVTGIQGIQYQKKFVPGVELLGLALAGAGGLAAASLFFRKETVNKNIS